jgi:predicted RNase H-like HicB family nuclease
MSTWVVVYEHGPLNIYGQSSNVPGRTTDGWGAYVPALPGCHVSGETRAEVGQRIREVIAAHIAGLNRMGLPIPDPDSIAVETVAV